MKTDLKNVSRREALLSGVGLASLTAGAAVVGGLVPERALAKDADGHKDCEGGESLSLPVTQIEAVFGVPGLMEPGGVLRFDFPRQDLSPTVYGTAVDPDWGFDTEIAFQATCKGAIVKWEFCLLDHEINPVLQGLLDANLSPRQSNVNAIHNHFLEANPKVKFMHGTAIGDSVAIAQALYNALKNHSAQPFPPSQPPATGLPDDQITSIIGGTGNASGKVLTVNVDRKDRFQEFEIKLEPALQIDANFQFQKIGANIAAVDAEFPLTNDEMDRVIRSLRSDGFDIMAVHNHELFIEPKLYYLHSSMAGDPLALAKAIRRALQHADFKTEG